MDVVYDFYGNRNTFEYEFEYEYEYVAVFMDILISTNGSSMAFIWKSKVKKHWKTSQ